VEHLMAALAGCLVDNARIEVEGPEIPILDGSSLPFVESINNSGVCTQGLQARYISVSEILTVENGGGSSLLSAIPTEWCELFVETSFPDWPDGDSSTTLMFEPGGAEFQDGIAPARTFAFADEVDRLLKSGLAQGGSVDNVVIITPPATFSTELRMAGEWWRHKVLDLIGDLALTDARLRCSVRANRPGHTINTRLAAALISERIAVSQEL
jgi:UDP-3-O-[3-hydroxymyristoyl] N-acetylglucosamine deacetylase